MLLEVIGCRAWNISFLGQTRHYAPDENSFDGRILTYPLERSDPRVLFLSIHIFMIILWFYVFFLLSLHFPPRLFSPFPVDRTCWSDGLFSHPQQRMVPTPQPYTNIPFNSTVVPPPFSSACLTNYSSQIPKFTQ